MTDPDQHTGRDIAAALDRQAAALEAVADELASQNGLLTLLADQHSEARWTPASLVEEVRVYTEARQ